MKSRQNKNREFIHIISDEKLAEFRNMPLRARLEWLEIANAFVNRAIGARRRAIFDNRFEAFISKKEK